MAVNKYMHPRNIYKSPPDFKQLAIEFPEFRQFVKTDISNKVTLDFKDKNALRALSATLLKRDFDLHVEMPANKLVPTIPLRLNYILWIEDLLCSLEQKERVRGIDIGTGASCVYPLLAAKKNNWEMLATEVDGDSVACARKNVANNSLESLVRVVQVSGETVLEGVLDGHDNYDFCMCNPPFFSSTQELHPFFKSRKSSRPHPKNAFCASVNEVVAQGGEVQFISSLVKESKRLYDKVKIYTTMVGHKSSLPALKKLLRESEVRSFKESQFCQGNTTRWGLAWTFCDVDLRKVVDVVKQTSKMDKAKPPLEFVIKTDETVDSVTEKLIALFRGLQMSSEEVTRNRNVRRYFITAYSNTWSHQRRKRREMSKNNDMETVDSPPGKNENNNEEKSPGKRTNAEAFEDGCFMKKLKISLDSDNDGTAAVFFKFTFAVRRDAERVVLELNNVDNTHNRDYLYQILQYIKNNASGL